MVNDTKQLPTAAVIIIGNEILSGRTQDTNLSYIAQALTKQGIRLSQASVLSDDIDIIAQEINRLRIGVNYVFTTGGIGPTHDDITAQAVAKAFDLDIQRHPDAVMRLQDHYGKNNLNEARLSMADMPVGAQLIDNPVSRSPGFWIENVYVLAGVPLIMQAMLDGLLPHLTYGPPILSHTLSTFLAEGDLADGLRTLQEDYPDIDVGSYPYFRRRRFGVSIVLRSHDKNRLEKCTAAAHRLIEGLEQAIHHDTPTTSHQNDRNQKQSNI